MSRFELLGQPAEARRVIADYQGEWRGKDCWLSLDVTTGDIGEWFGADELLAHVRKQDGRSAKAGVSRVTQIEWRNVPDGFKPPELAQP